MQFEVRRLDTLCPYAHHPRRNDHAAEQMEASIREFGFKISLVSSDGEVMATGRQPLYRFRGCKLA